VTWRLPWQDYFENTDNTRRGFGIFKSDFSVSETSASPQGKRVATRGLRLLENPDFRRDAGSAAARGVALIGDSAHEFQRRDCVRHRMIDGDNGFQLAGELRIALDRP
jgi:hypothetical protein